MLSRWTEWFAFHPPDSSHASRTLPGEFSVGSLKALIAVTFAEATSWIGLLIAMVFKYGFEMETGVEVMGRVHGFFFMAFVALLVLVHFQRNWSIRKTAIAFAESVPPFTGFLLGKQLLDELRRDERRAPSTA